jgi:DNA-binding transcriptional LysR family regulator
MSTLLSSLSIDGLRCFAEAARLLNFRGAARVVAISPAAFGQRIQKLEHELGQVLFRRTTRSIVLTKAGLRLLPAASRALAAVDECARAGRGELQAAPLELVLGTRHELGMSWIVPMLPALERALPGLTLHLYVGSGADLSQRVRSGELDCAVTSSRILDPKLDGLRLHEERYVFVAARALVRRRPLRRAQDARMHTLYDITAELPLFRYWADTAGSIDSLAFGRVIRLGTIAAIRWAVLRGDGVAVLPHYFVEADLRARRLIELLPHVRAHADWFRLLTRTDDPRRSVFERLGEAMRAHPLRAHGR